MKRTLAPLIFLFVISVLSAQEKKYAPFWDALLQNDRKKAETLIRKDKASEMELLLRKEYLRQEMGYFDENNAFISEFIGQTDMEYYLFALWNEFMLFDDYLDKSLTNNCQRTIDALYNQEFRDGTVKEAVKYLYSIKKRHEWDLEAYEELQSQIPSMKDWQYCGTFENMNKSGLDIPYLPESTAISQTDFNAQRNGLINWYTPAENKREAYQFFMNQQEFGYGVHYAQSFIELDADKRMVLNIGAGSAFKVWVNDVEVYADRHDVIREMDAARIMVNLSKGINRILVKIAATSEVPYFLVRMTDENNVPITDLKSTAKYSPYVKGTVETVKPELLSNEYIEYFQSKRKEDPNNFLYEYALIKTYLRYSLYEEAKEVLNGILTRYPKSSFLKKIQMEILEFEKDQTTINSITENFEKEDPNYYMPFIYKMADTQEMNRMTIAELSEWVEDLSKVISYPMILESAGIFLNFRKQDKPAVKKGLDKIVLLLEDQPKTLATYASLYDSYFNEEEKTITILEEHYKKYFEASILDNLIDYYDKNNRQDEIIKLLVQAHEKMPYDNQILSFLTDKLIKFERYEEAIPYLKKALENYPYSFVAMRQLGKSYLHTGNKKEALEWMKKSLSHDNGNNRLRKEINDQLNIQPPFKGIMAEDDYAYIQSTRNKIKENNYGYNILLDEAFVNLYDQNGGHIRTRSAYEITGENGIDFFKEYNLGITGTYNVVKSEIVKQNGSVVPADRKGANLVFTSLEIGDVIYIDYEYDFIGDGRFYKDFIGFFQFNSYHPTVKSQYNLIVPKPRKINYTVVNREVAPTIKDMGDHTMYVWKQENLPAGPLYENMMPNDADTFGCLHLSTINSWNDIAVWYSDLVRVTREIDKTVKDTFQVIFPDGFQGMTESERAQKIYYYMANNLNYSYVSFRQSGFIPQRPSKVLKTKLGDCKDFSTLFVTLAEMAGLEANLVLIRTSDLGRKSLILPSQDFNHCIAKVKIDGSFKYLELTDKNLPFLSIPNSLKYASALDIPKHVNEKTTSDLYNLGDVTQIKSIMERKIDVQVYDDHLELEVETKAAGALKGNYMQLFEETSQESLKQNLFDDFKSYLNADFKLDSLYTIVRKRESNELSFKSTIAIQEENKTIGSFKILKLPDLLNIYTGYVVENENRNYPIEYIQYERNEEYRAVYNIKLDEKNEFIEVPKNKKLTYKKHSFDINYEKTSPRLLKVTITGITDLTNIESNEYLAFKEYVKEVLKAKEAYIGYKAID